MGTQRRGCGDLGYSSLSCDCPLDLAAILQILAVSLTLNSYRGMSRVTELLDETFFHDLAKAGCLRGNA